MLELGVEGLLDVYGVQGEDLRAAAEQLRAQTAQFARLDACFGLFERWERRTSWNYDWLVRSRPDLYFYAAALPRLATLDTEGTSTGFEPKTY